MEYSPIVLFVYNRPYHTEETLLALGENLLAAKSDLFIYCDGPKSKGDIEMVTKVRNITKSVRGFKSIKIIEREENLGLAASIKQGVTKVINKYGKIIVLEDDIKTSPYFLNYMNRALDQYENEEKVMEVSGYIYPIDRNNLPESFFSSMAACWGWGTWSRAWQKYTEDYDLLEKSIISRGKMKFIVSSKFSYWDQLQNNKKGILSSWFIFWYASIYINEGLCLYPASTYTNNLGLDGSGTNSGTQSSFNSSLNRSKNISFPTEISEFDTKNVRFAQFFNSLRKQNLLRRILNYLNINT